MEEKPRDRTSVQEQLSAVQGQISQVKEGGGRAPRSVLILVSFL